MIRTRTRSVSRGPSTRLGHLVILLAMLVVPAVPLSAAPSPEDDLFSGATTLEPEELVDLVLTRNPSLEGSRQAWRAALARAPQAESLDDPVLSYRFAPLSVPSDEPSFGHSISVRQSFPFPGKRSLRGEAAKAEADAARGEMEAVRRRLAGMAVTLHADYALVERSLAINREHLQLLSEIRRVAVARYTAGEGTQDEPLQAEVETARLEQRRIRLRSMREVIRAQLNALLHRDPGAILPPPGPLPPVRTPSAPAVALEAEALDERPELHTIDARLRSRRALVDLSGKSAYPDLGLMAEYNSMWAMTEHQWMVGVSLNLPLRGDRRGGERDEAQARLRRTASDRDQLVDRIRLEVHTGLERVAETTQILDLYESRILPASRDRVAAARVAYETGRTSFLHLIEAERDLRTARLQYEETRTEQVRAQVDLDLALGRVPGLPGEGESS